MSAGDDEKRRPVSIHIEQMHIGAGATGIAAVTESLREASHEEPERDRDREDLARLRKRRQRIRDNGGDTTEVDEQLRGLKRKLLLPGPLQVADDLGGDRYILESVLGAGGIGTVWLATDTQDNDRRVAVKVLHGQFSGDLIMKARFARGARAMAALAPNGTVEVLAPAVIERGWMYYVMEYVGGGDLHQAVLKGTLSSHHALELIPSVALTLERAHSMGILHRDISPSNVLVSERGPLLCDFDLVHLSDSTAATRTGALGKVVYAAPELMGKTEDVDARADVYSLGMTAVFCAARRELGYDAMIDPVGFLHRLRLPSPVAKAIGRAISRRREDRYSNALEFATALKVSLGSHQVVLRDGEPTLRILVVDDEQVIREILADFLSMEGMWVRTAADGSAALAELSRNEYDVVLTDLKMPGMGGYQLLRAIKQHTPSVAVIIMTGFETVGTTRECLRAGAFDYITKPFKVEEVVGVLRESVGSLPVRLEG